MERLETEFNIRRLKTNIRIKSIIKKQNLINGKISIKLYL